MSSSTSFDSNTLESSESTTHQKLALDDFHPTSVGETVFRGQTVRVVDYTNEPRDKEGQPKELSTAKRVGLGVLNAGLTVATAGTALLSSEFREDWDTVVEGKATRKVHYVTNKKEVLPGDFGYKPQNKASIQHYLNKKRIRSQLQSDGHGNFFLLETRRTGISSFLFVPKGDFSKARSVKYYKTTNDPETNGKAVTDPEEQLRAVRAYGASIANIDTEWDKEAQKIAVNLRDKRNKGLQDTDSNYMPEDEVEALKERVKKQRGPVVLDHQCRQARVYSKKVDLNTNMASCMTGTIVSLDAGTKKSLTRIFGDDMEYKPPLEGERPFAKPPQPADSSSSGDPLDALRNLAVNNSKQSPQPHPRATEERQVEEVPTSDNDGGLNQVYPFPGEDLTTDDSLDFP